MLIEAKKKKKRKEESIKDRSSRKRGRQGKAMYRKEKEMARKTKLERKLFVRRE